MTVDYRTLLIKYIAHVGHEEGVSYVDTANPDSRMGPRNPRNPVRFTSGEYQALLEASQQPADSAPHQPPP